MPRIKKPPWASGRLRSGGDSVFQDIPSCTSSGLPLKAPWRLLARLPEAIKASLLMLYRQLLDFLYTVKRACKYSDFMRETRVR